MGSKFAAVGSSNHRLLLLAAVTFVSVALLLWNLDSERARRAGADETFSTSLDSLKLELKTLRESNEAAHVKQVTWQAAQKSELKADQEKSASAVILDFKGKLEAVVAEMTLFKNETQQSLNAINAYMQMSDMRLPQFHKDVEKNIMPKFKKLLARVTKLEQSVVKEM